MGRAGRVGFVGLSLIVGTVAVSTARFDIEAKADREYSAREDAPAPELLAMLRNLAANRFRLSVAVIRKLSY